MATLSKHWYFLLFIFTCSRFCHLSIANLILRTPFGSCSHTCSLYFERRTFLTVWSAISVQEKINNPLISLDFITECLASLFSLLQLVWWWLSSVLGQSSLQRIKCGTFCAGGEHQILILTAYCRRRPNAFKPSGCLGNFRKWSRGAPVRANHSSPHHCGKQDFIVNIHKIVYWMIILQTCFKMYLCHVVIHAGLGFVKLN